MKAREEGRTGGLQLAAIAALPPEKRMEAAIAAVVPMANMQALEVAYDLFGGCLADPKMGHAQRAVLTGAAVTALRQALEGPVLEAAIMPLQNHPSGFDTDKNPAKGWEGATYAKEVVLGCAVQAILTGLPLTGNVWNIIGGSFYVRKEGFEQLVASRCRYSVLAKVPIKMADELYDTGGYVPVPVTVLYQVHGETEDQAPRKFTATYNIRLTKRNKVAPDYLEGKAKRKALRDLWAILSGQLLAEVGDEAQDGIAATGSPSASAAGDVGEILRNSKHEPSATEPPQPQDSLQEGDLEELKEAAEKAGFAWSEVERAATGVRGLGCAIAELRGDRAVLKAEVVGLIRRMPLEEADGPQDGQLGLE